MLALSPPSCCVPALPPSPTPTCGGSCGADGMKGKLFLLQAVAAHNTSLCMSQQVQPYNAPHISICLYRLPEAPGKSVPCKGLNPGLQPPSGAAWPGDQADIVSARTAWEAQQQQMVYIRKAFASSAVYSYRHFLKVNSLMFYLSELLLLQQVDPLTPSNG